MNFFPLILLLFSAASVAKSLPSDIRLDTGSLVILKQYIESKSDADQSFPVFVNLSCKPKLKSEKISGYDCKIADIKYATKLK
jgi:hypothetical protein